MKPYDVNTIADYIIQCLNVDDEGMNLINLKLQKLLYYLQAWSLGINKERFLKSTFEAWVHGPVCKELYDRFKETKSLYSFITLSDMLDTSPKTKIVAGDVEFINFILENYAGFSGAELEAMTHKEEPWIEARKGLAPMERGNRVISEASMSAFYGKKWEQIQGK